MVREILLIKTVQSITAKMCYVLFTQILHEEDTASGAEF